MSTASMTLRSLQRRAPAAGLGREFYHDAAIYDLDLQLIFYREWLFAAHEAELHGTGSYVTLQVGAYPVVLVRAASGAIRAFVNSCRHRGSRVCAAARGRAAKLVCPYHQWTYDLDGRLFAARQMGAGFDRTPFALRRVHCEAIAGYVFICLADEAPDFTATRVQLTAYLAPHRLHEAKVAYESTIIEEELARELFRHPDHHRGERCGRRPVHRGAALRSRRIAQRVPALAPPASCAAQLLRACR